MSDKTEDVTEDEDPEQTWTVYPDPETGEPVRVKSEDYPAIAKRLGL